MRLKGRKIILLYVALGFLIIWIREYVRSGLANSYWALLLMLVFLFWYQFLNIADKNREASGDAQPEVKEKKKTAKRKNK